MYFLEQRVKMSCKTCDCELLLWSEVQEVKWGVTSWMMSVQYTSWKKMIIEDTADLFMVDKKYPLAFTVLVNVISMPKWYVIILYEFKDIKMSILYSLHYVNKNSMKYIFLAYINLCIYSNQIVLFYVTILICQFQLLQVLGFLKR